MSLCWVYASFFESIKPELMRIILNDLHALIAHLFNIEQTFPCDSRSFGLKRNCQPPFTTISAHFKKDS